MIIDARAGRDRVLFGSDFPARSLADSLRLCRELGMDQGSTELVLGANAARLFDL